jgi:hypothetical protein
MRIAMEDQQKQTSSEIDFSTFIISLATSALFNLGLVQTESGKASEVNLPVASQTIDILALLKEKTKGNLTDDEGKVLDSLLFDLRMKFIEVAKNQKK